RQTGWLEAVDRALGPAFWAPGNAPSRIRSQRRLHDLLAGTRADSLHREESTFGGWRRSMGSARFSRRAFGADEISAADFVPLPGRQRLRRLVESGRSSPVFRGWTFI